MVKEVNFIFPLGSFMMNILFLLAQHMVKEIFISSSLSEALERIYYSFRHNILVQSRKFDLLSSLLEAYIRIYYSFQNNIWSRNLYSIFSLGNFVKNLLFLPAQHTVKEPLFLFPPESFIKNSLTFLPAQ